MKRQLPVVILWHMHQPSYVDPVTDESAMPWVRLHAMKDYYDMGRAVREVPGAKAVFNFVPSLWEQLENIGHGKNLDLHEIIARKPTEELTEDERLFVAENFFSSHYDTMILPHSPFLTLYNRFGPGGSKEAILKADTQDVRDLIVWFHLSWCGKTLSENPDIAALFEKGTGFSEEEKISLLDRIRNFVREIPAYYKTLVDEGCVEVTTTPYYHPILPLLIDPDSAHEACPGMELPVNRFPLPTDAEEHVRRGVAMHERIFDSAPDGFWPAEGSVSTKVARMFADCGIKWIATDEDVLRLSLGVEELTNEEKYRLYEIENTTIFFRDHDLSDRIGFTYSKMNHKDAIDDLVSALDTIKESLPEDGSFVVPIILDGENCWEFYEDLGWPFLIEFYERLVGSENYILDTANSIRIRYQGEATKLERLHAGSWIFANFTTWVGDPVKNKAWTYLYDARQAIVQSANEKGEGDPAVAQAMEHIYAAEGSDWFWWFGEGHSSAYDALFDKIFRQRLTAVYEALGMAIPGYLDKPVDDRWEQSRSYTLPVHSMTPTIDGRKGSYYEWLAAGVCYPGGGSMQRSSLFMKMLYFGFDTDFIYFRIEIDSDAKSSLENSSIEVVFSSPEILKFSFDFENGNKPDNNCNFAFDECLEIAIPFTEISKSIQPGDPIAFHIVLVSNGKEMERLPESSPIEFDSPSDTFDEENWYV